MGSWDARHETECGAAPNMDHLAAGDEEQIVLRQQVHKLTSVIKKRKT
jgi:hypothetical protein